MIMNEKELKSIIKNKLFYELKMEASKCNYFLNIYTPELDHMGFNYILDDLENMAKVKFMIIDKRKDDRSFLVKKSLLRPDHALLKQKEIDFLNFAPGLGGCIILAETDSMRDFSVNYYYTDYLLIKAFSLQLVWSENKITQNFLNDFLYDLKRGAPKEEISVNKRLFIQAQDPEALLCLTGLDTKSYDRWRAKLINLIKKESSLANEQAQQSIFEITETLMKLSQDIKVFQE